MGSLLDVAMLGEAIKAYYDQQYRMGQVKQQQQQLKNSGTNNDYIRAQMEQMRFNQSLQERQFEIDRQNADLAQQQQRQANQMNQFNLSKLNAPMDWNKIEPGFNEWIASEETQKQLTAAPAANRPKMLFDQLKRMAAETQNPAFMHMVMSNQEDIMNMTAEQLREVMEGAPTTATMPPPHQPPPTMSVDASGVDMGKSLFNVPRPAGESQFLNFGGDVNQVIVDPITGEPTVNPLGTAPGSNKYIETTADNLRWVGHINQDGEIKLDALGAAPTTGSGKWNDLDKAAYGVMTKRFENEHKILDETIELANKELKQTELALEEIRTAQEEGLKKPLRAANVIITEITRTDGGFFSKAVYDDMKASVGTIIQRLINSGSEFLLGEPTQQQIDEAEAFVTSFKKHYQKRLKEAGKAREESYRIFDETKDPRTALEPLHRYLTPNAEGDEQREIQKVFKGIVDGKFGKDVQEAVKGVEDFEVEKNDYGIILRLGNGKILQISPNRNSVKVVEPSAGTPSAPPQSPGGDRGSANISFTPPVVDPNASPISVSVGPNGQQVFRDAAGTELTIDENGQFQFNHPNAQQPPPQMPPTVSPHAQAGGGPPPMQTLSPHPQNFQTPQVSVAPPATPPQPVNQEKVMELIKNIDGYERFYPGGGKPRRVRPPKNKSAQETIDEMRSKKAQYGL